MKGHNSISTDKLIEKEMEKSKGILLMTWEEKNYKIRLDGKASQSELILGLDILQ